MVFCILTAQETMPGTQIPGRLCMYISNSTSLEAKYDYRCVSIALMYFEVRRDDAKRN